MIHSTVLLIKIHKGTLFFKTYAVKLQLFESCDLFEGSGQQIRSKIESFQNAKFIISQPNPMVWALIGIVSERRFRWGSDHRVWLRNEKVIWKSFYLLFLNLALKDIHSPFISYSNKSSLCNMRSIVLIFHSLLLQVYCLSVWNT